MKKISIKILNVVLAVVLLCTMLSSCVGQKKAKFSNAKAKQGTVSNAIATYNANNMDLIKGSNLVELYFDRVSFCPVIKYRTTGAFWSGLSKENANADVVRMKVEYKGKIYELFSQKNAVALGKAAYSYTDDGVLVKYDFEVGEKEEIVKIPFEIDFSLKDGCLYATADLENFKNLKDVNLISLDILPFFGSVKDSVEGDYMLVPDGCGAIIKTAAPGNANYDIKTYGSDFGVRDKKEIPYSTIAAFGVKHEKNAFAGMVVEGDSLSRIIANKKQGGYNNIYPTFDITPTNLDKNGKGNIGKNSYNGKVKVAYRFLSGNKTTPALLASLVREQLIRENFLSDLNEKEKNEVPVNLSILGRMKVGAFKKNFTTYDEALEMLTHAKSKGINNINIRYVGALEGGNRQKQLRFANISNMLGTDKSFSKLEDYSRNQQCNLFLDTKLFNLSGRKAFDIGGRMIKFAPSNPIEEQFDKDKATVFPSSQQKAYKQIISFNKNMKKHNITGYCVSDASKYLYSDFYNKKMNREAASLSVKEQIKQFPNSKNIAVEHGNLYSLLDVGVIYNLPYKTTYKQSNFYEEIPFIQMILHGNVDYSIGYFNLSEDHDTILLKSIEYGAVPSYVWAFDDKLSAGDEKSKFYYENSINKAVEDYTKINTAFSDLRYAKITDHTKISDGLYRTEFNNGTFIYVNYNKSDITHESFIIKARSFLRIN
ncbi:MAG: DUF5696 domain-containing protein [Clostridia bacterium]|nr:DUF5696 domain-containing protein [Clostridia bacterium]